MRELPELRDSSVENIGTLRALEVERKGGFGYRGVGRTGESTKIGKLTELESLRNLKTMRGADPDLVRELLGVDEDSPA